MQDNFSSMGRQYGSELSALPHVYLCSVNQLKNNSPAWLSLTLPIGPPRIAARHRRLFVSRLPGVRQWPLGTSRSRARAQGTTPMPKGRRGDPFPAAYPTSARFLDDFVAMITSTIGATHRPAGARSCLAGAFGSRRAPIRAVSARAGKSNWEADRGQASTNDVLEATSHYIQDLRSPLPVPGGPDKVLESMRRFSEQYARKCVVIGATPLVRGNKRYIIQNSESKFHPRPLQHGHLFLR